MQKSIWYILLAITFSACRGYVPSTMLAVPSAIAPLHMPAPSPDGRTTSYDYQLFAGADYTTGPGTDEGENFYLIRPHIACTIVDESPFQGIIGFMGLGGEYNARMWGQYYLDNGITHKELSVYGLGTYSDVNASFTNAFLTIGVGTHLMMAWEGGEYRNIWDGANRWSFPIVMQFSGYSFIHVDITESVKVALRGGVSLPAEQSYINGTFAWDRILVGFGGGRLREEGMCYTTGISYRL